jgi:NAD(P)-dependent dehydrogenase (short-subunit alcohol dehydrogenase family)
MPNEQGERSARLRRPASPGPTKVALVTGGARGIGAAIARGLVESGVRAAILDLDGEALQSCPLDVLKIQANVVRHEDCEAAVAQVRAEYGDLDVMINNAGIGMSVIREDHFDRPIRLAEIEPDHWRRFFEINCMGAFLMTRAAVPQMVAKGWGRVVNVTTSFLTMLNEGFAPYGPAKAALEAASAIWAKEFRDTGVTVNVLIPGGPTDTRMVPASAPFARSEMLPPAAMAPPACWLASPASDGVTGRRFVAGLWDAALPPEQAAAAAGAPIAWPQLASQGAVWPERRAQVGSARPHPPQLR